MPTIKEILVSLPKDKHREIMDAFNDERAFHVDLDDGTFLGVHIYMIPQIEVIERAGYFLHGRFLPP